MAVPVTPRPWENLFTSKIQLLARDGSIRAATIEGTVQWMESGGGPRLCRIALSSADLELTGDGPDFWEAFCRIREALSEHSLLPLCYAASRDVFPSGMCRNMGIGLKAYRKPPGRLALDLDDLVEIFDTAPDIDPVSVEEQALFNRSWLESSRGSLRKVAVRVDEPVISKDGRLLTLAYTLTNKTDDDLLVVREGRAEHDDIMNGAAETKLCMKVKSSGAYYGVGIYDNSVNFLRTSLPAHVVVHFFVSVQVPEQEQSWWQRKRQVTPDAAIARTLSDVDAIVLLLAKQRIKIVLPIKR